VVNQVLLVWEENHSYSSVVGNPSAPELNSLAAQCGLATQYAALTHPSLPNYMERTSGRSYASYPWDSDCDPQGTCTTSAKSIFEELGTSGRQWRSYVEAMGHNCGLASYGQYAAKHNPAVYYTAIRRECDAWDQPLGTLTNGPLHQALATGPTVALTTVTPDLQDDMHDGTVAQADGWLADWLPQVVASPAYRSGHLAVLVAWDEGSGPGNVASHTPLIVVSASTPSGARSAVAFNDFSVLLAICQLTGVASLGKASTAASLVGPFHL
jgi:acid phosphatase